jgi:hypothetical protein
MAIVVAPNRRGMPGGVEWNEQISKDWGGQVDDYLQLLTTYLKKVMLTNSLRLCWRVMVDIRHFIWPEYTTIVLKPLLMMAFSTRKACLEQQKKFFLQQLGFWWPVLGKKRQCYSSKNLYSFNPINLVENGTRQS